MNHRPHRILKGLLASALAVGASAVLAATPAHAVTQTTIGNLVFTATRGTIIGGADSGGTNVVGSGGTSDPVDSKTVTISSGDTDITVTQKATPTVTTISITNNYTGTLTLNGVEITNNGAAPLTFAATAVNTVPINGAGATVVLGPGTKISQTAAGAFSAVTEAGFNSDKLVFAGGTVSTNSSSAATINVQNGGANSLQGGLVVETQTYTSINGTPGGVFNVAANNSTHQSPAQLTFTGGGTLVLNASGTNSAINVANGNTTGQDADVSVNGGNVVVQAATPTNGAIYLNANANAAQKVTLSVEAGSLTVNQATGAAHSAIYANNNSTNNCFVNVSGGTLTVNTYGLAIDAANATLPVAVSNGSLTNGAGPTVILNNMTTTTAGPVVGTNVSVTPDAGSTSAQNFYPWLAQRDPDGPKNVDGGSNVAPEILSFAGANNNPFSVVNGNSTCWVKISPQPITALTATDAQDYVWATTDSFLSEINGVWTGVDPQRVVSPTLVPTFEGVDDSIQLATGVSVAATVSAFDVTPEANVEQIGTTGNYYVVPDATGNELSITYDENVPSAIQEYYPRLDVTDGTLNVVYTVTMETNPTYGVFTNGAGIPNDGNPVAVATDKVAQIVTAPDATGAITNVANPDLYEDATDKIDSFEYSTILDLNGVINDYDSSLKLNSDDIGLVGMLQDTVATAAEGEDEPTAPTTTLIPLDQVTTDRNLELTAAFAYVNSETPVPSPATVGRDGSVDITATIDVKPIWPADLSLATLQLNNLWDGGFNYAIADDYGDLAGNGVTLTPGDIVNNNDGTYTAHVTVSADNTATLGTYRVWWDNYISNQNAKPSESPVDAYGIVQVTESGTISGEVTVWRLYNQWSHEHLYTTSATEQQTLVAAGWDLEGIAWVAPQASDIPVYRLYNPYNHDHYYCTSRSEATELIGLGWQPDFNFGAAFYSADQGGAPIYQLFNPYETSNTHLWTGDFNEYTVNQQRGWEGQGTAWYALALN